MRAILYKIKIIFIIIINIHNTNAAQWYLIIYDGGECSMPSAVCEQDCVRERVR